MTIKLKPNPAYDWAITERGPHQFQVRFRRKGFPKGADKTFDTRQLAEQYVREIETERFEHPHDFVARHERRQIANETTVSDLIDGYEAKISRTRKRIDDSEIARLKNMREMPIGAVLVSALKPHHVEQYRDQRLATGVSGGTVVRDLNVLQAVLQHAAEKQGSGQFLTPNPASRERVQYPPESPHRTRILVGDEYDRLITACRTFNRSPYLWAITELAIETAMRQGELVRLRWRDVNFDHKTIYVADTKSGKPRSVPISPKSREVLDEWLEYEKKRSHRVKRKLPDQVFPGLTGEAVKQAFPRSCKVANIEDLRFHDLRHHATTQLFMKYKLQMIEVMSITGHSNATMTERYTHIAAAALAEKMQGLDEEVKIDSTLLANLMGEPNSLRINLNAPHSDNLERLAANKKMTVREYVEHLIDREAKKAKLVLIGDRATA